jgi:hypothetical protein
MQTIQVPKYGMFSTDFGVDIEFMYKQSSIHKIMSSFVKLKTSCIKRIRQDLKATPYLGKMALNKMTSEEIILSSGDSNQKSKKGLSNGESNRSSHLSFPHHNPDDPNAAAIVGAELENDLKFDRKKCENRKGEGAFILKDYSQMPPANGNTAGISNMIVQKLPVKLVAILNDQASQDIVSWLPHGRAWKIQNTYLFVNQVLPNYFEKPNYNSFIRLTNAWGFRRITRGVDKDAYYHEVSLIAAMFYKELIDRIRNLYTHSLFSCFFEAYHTFIPGCVG